MTLLIKMGTLITSSETFNADILVEGEQIKAIGRDLQVPENCHGGGCKRDAGHAGGCGCSCAPGFTHV